ncbi:MAG: hypothetical protein MMC23_007224 [Stictis urceolatum]|nr:hypothetical protein [Stictis urceolata]
MCIAYHYTHEECEHDARMEIIFHKAKLRDDLERDEQGNIKRDEQGNLPKQLYTHVPDSVADARRESPLRVEVLVAWVHS